MSILPDLLAANERYATRFTRGNLPPMPVRRLAILTCMDSRLMPAQMMGLVEGDAHVLRNAGARATPDAIRSLILSHEVLGTKEILVVHHTECGMQRVTNEALRDQLRERGGSEVDDLDFLPFTDQVQALLDDVQTIRSTPFIPDWVPVSGLIYDVKTGKLEHVV